MQTLTTLIEPTDLNEKNRRVFRSICSSVIRK